MYKPTIGLETHVELNTRSKMFCSCLNVPNERHPNVNICPTCTAQPGSLPVINEEAVKKVIKTGLALNCQIPEYSKFDRKNYFYPDLPKGYQISQYDAPLCKEGKLQLTINPEQIPSELYGASNHPRKRLATARRRGEQSIIRIRRVHLEEDTGRLIHEKDCSLVDFNRAGIPLMELVTEPDLNSAIESRKFAEELQLILRYLDVSNADMEKGQMRVEVNISLRPKIPNSQFPISNNLGTKVEIKNLNSFRAVERAIDYEIKRQEKILKTGKKVIQETRGWDDNKGVTVPQREKEEAHDYRYFPEPDLPPLHFTKQEIEKIRAEIPELPQQKRERFEREYQLDEKSIEIFVQNKELGEYFEKVISELPPKIPKNQLPRLIKLVTNYLITDLQGLLKGASVSGEDFLITPENFAEFITLISEGKISSKIAKIILEEMFKTGADPSHIIEEKELSLITDEKEIEKIIKEVISENQKTVEDFKKGKEKAIEFLIGKVMAKTKGKANPKITKDLLTKILKT